MKREYIISAAVLLCAVGLLVYYNFRLPKEVKACKEEAMEEVMSPSSFNMVEYNVYDESITLDEFKKIRYHYVNDSDITGILMRNVTDPIKRSIFITFDAPNAFGTPARGAHRCEYVLESRQKGVSDLDIMARRSKVSLERIEKVVGTKLR